MGRQRDLPEIKISKKGGKIKQKIITKKISSPWN
jgi:hypothetical protein